MTSAAISLLAATLGATPEAPPPPGFTVGAVVPTFYVRHVTSANPNSLTCLVCRYGARPVVMVCSNCVNRQVSDLLRAVDKVVDEKRGDGLKGFGVFAPDAVQEVQPWLMRVARRSMLSLPLTMPVDNATCPPGLDAAQVPATSILFYEQRQVVAAYHYAEGELGEPQIAHAVQIARMLAAGQRGFPAPPAVSAEPKPPTAAPQPVTQQMVTAEPVTKQMASAEPSRGP